MFKNKSTFDLLNSNMYATLWYIDQKIYIMHTRKYGRPFFLPFGNGRVQELFRMTNILNDNNSEGMTMFGRNDTKMEGMTRIRKE